LVGLPKLNSELDRRHVRRALTADELGTLIKTTAESGKTYRGSDWQLTAKDRSMLYAIASHTGLRASELASLTKSSFDFEAMTWTVQAASAKNRTKETLPLSPALAVRLRDWFVNIKREELFSGTWAKRNRAARILRQDLKRAGIPYRDADGNVCDFHSLRTTFITQLANGGVHPSKAQRLARHSDIRLTMNVYTKLNADELRSSIGSLPDMMGE
jgi:integrase